MVAIVTRVAARRYIRSSTTTKEIELYSNLNAANSKIVNEQERTVNPSRSVSRDIVW